MEIKRRSTFAILFYINRTKVRKDGTCQLLCKISIDAKWEQIGTKVSVNPATSDSIRILLTVWYEMKKVELCPVDSLEWTEDTGF